ncbi:phosphoribosylanthranilate isomerase [Lacticaseibacillus zhaodongensis]|uniref:phosphoribosylanthranilate isomerase n=1 Tax=Lacticaseibacillus zhaodongensis TaxID=2668065 RepID=UPI0012D2C6F7|nr:phosphoribosylanthranilate isomerase [Lacticaseibacillus zhaodongensis]
MTAIKICGLMTAADVAAVNQYQPDYAGFVFAHGRHQLTVPTASKLIQQLDANITPVGVFMNNDIDLILAAVHAGIKIVQLHGSEPDAIIALLQERGVKVIRVFKAPLPQVADTPADYAMLDAGAGSGHKLDWQNLPSSNKPIFLAGGITPANIDKAITTVHPYAVDVSSGVEAAGKKDPALIAAIIASAHKH